MSVTRFQRIIIIIIVILSSLLLWNCWNCPFWCLMTCVHFSNYLIHCLIWPIPIEIDATWCIFCDWVTGKPLYINIFVFKVDSSSRTIVWRYFQSSVSPPHLTCPGSLSPSPLVSQAQSSTPLLSYIIKSIMFMDLLWEVYIKPAWQWELDLKFSMSSYSDEVQTCNQ